MLSLLRSCLLRSARRWIFIGVISRAVSVESLPWRGFAATCCACSSVSFGWEIVRDLPMVNIVSQTMNQHKSLSWIIHENAPWSSAAKSMLPGNAKCSMTSLADTKHIFRERKIYLWSLEFRSWLRPRAVSRLRARFARDEIEKSLPSRRFARNQISLLRGFRIARNSAAHWCVSKFIPARVEGGCWLFLVLW